VAQMGRDSTAVEESKHIGMSTVMTHRAFGKHAGQALKAVREEAERLEGLLSRFIPGSDISRVNRSAGVQSEALGDEAFEVLAQAVEFSKCCRGLFDVTIGPLVKLWSDSKGTCTPPEEARIRQVLPLVGYTSLMLGPDKKTAGLLRPGQSIDLGGIGKGYAGDRFVDVFREYGVSSAFTNIGGNVVALGTKPDGSPWRVGIQHPRQESSLIGLVSATDKAVVTSGDYQRYFMDDKGKRYHHILNPTTGYPAEPDLVSVTVVAESSMDADALSTMFFIAGLEKGLSLLKGFNGVEAIAIGRDMRVHVTAGLAESFQAGEGINVEIMN
jgi:FAD:protein FMN transferase